MKGHALFRSIKVLASLIAFFVERASIEVCVLGAISFVFSCAVGLASGSTPMSGSVSNESG